MSKINSNTKLTSLYEDEKGIQRIQYLRNSQTHKRDKKCCCKNKKIGYKHDSSKFAFTPRTSDPNHNFFEVSSYTWSRLPL